VPAGRIAERKRCGAARVAPQQLHGADAALRPKLSRMRWLIGVELRERDRGALSMGAWLHAQPFAEPTELVAVHVIDERIWGPRDVAEALRPSAERALARELESLGPSSGLVSARVVAAPSVASGLARMARELECDGMVIGRAAPRRGRQIVRLGSTARRILRELPMPVMVVPADMPRADIGAGPLVLGVDLERSSVAAARLTFDLAAGLERGVVVVHVDSWYLVIPDYVGGGAVVMPREPRRVPADVSSWVERNGLPQPTEIQIGDGDVVERLIDEASRVAAPIVVVGSRELDVVDRVFSSSVASALARNADRAVLVVPPAHGKQP
jgi:nucleotide-binding universal stress UspA family protein